MGTEKTADLQRVVNQPKRHPSNPVVKGASLREGLGVSL
jgi:hypothetical protein